MHPFPFDIFGVFSDSKKLRCNKVVLDESNIQFYYGGKVLLPTTYLSQLVVFQESGSPMMFSILNRANKRKTCVGVLQFTAPEGTVCVPGWVFEQLGLTNDGDIVDVQFLKLPLGTFAKFQPLSLDFLDISNPKILLERALRFYTCISTNDCIEITYCNKVYKICVKEVKPKDSVCVIDCNLSVEFESPPGYEEYQEELKIKRTTLCIHDKISKFIEEEQKDVFKVFDGTGSRLDGKRKKKRPNTSESKLANNSTNTDSSIVMHSGYPDYNWKFGVINFDSTFHLRIKKQAK